MTKRKKKSNNNNNKRFKPNNDGGNNDNYDASRGYIDTTTGQRGAFPGLARDDEPFLGPAFDGLSYLRMVRSEAALVPPLLLSSAVRRPPPPPPRVLRPGNYEVSVDTLDYDDPAPAPDTLDYDDPAPSISRQPESSAEQYLAATEADTDPYHEEEEDEDPNYVFAESTYVSLHASPPPPPPPPYHAALVSKFRSVRDKIHANPPLPAPGIEFPRKFAHKWTIDTPPTMAILWAMDMQRVIRMTQNVTRMIGTGTRTVRRGIPKRVGEWAWALLVRCESAMGPDEVYVIREMGKMAVNVLRQVREQRSKIDATMEGQVDEIADEGDNVVTEAGGEADYAVDLSAQGNDSGEVGGNTSPSCEAPMQSDEMESGKIPESKVFSAPSTNAARSEAATTGEEASTEDHTVPANNETAGLELGTTSHNLKNPGATVSDEVKEEEEEVDWGYTQATLDMIISVVGDHFGQRDLLETRTLMEVE